MQTSLRSVKAIEDLSDIYDQESEQEALAILIEPRYLAMLKSVHELIVATFPTMEDFRLDDPATRAVLDRAAEQVVRIDEHTRSELRDLLKEAQRLGLSNWEIANGSPKDDFPGIEGLFKEKWRGRAATIARNEILESQHVAALDRYKATGLVDRVRIRDGTGTAPDAPCLSRNGDVVPLESDPQRLHVNCSVVVVPILRGEPA